ncbi:MAG: PEP-CTERM sorting domain-containing protein [Syntrophobacteraceae bacterium]|nr:PEP-CTERM sorting domain-containing protein [Syntrophobacteraceae bacterium]
MSAHPNRKLVFLLAAVLAVVAVGVWSVPAQATTFTFDDEYYISSSSEFSTIFQGYVGPPNYSTPGYWQVLTTKNGQFWSGPSSTITPSYVFKYSSTFTTEFIQNDPNNTGTQGTIGQDRLALSGFSSLGGSVNGAVVGKATTTSPIGASFVFYGVNGSQFTNPPVAFTFNGFNLSGTATGVIFEVLDSNNNILYTSNSFNLTSGGTIIDPEIASAYKVLFTAGSGTLNVDNVEINDAIPSVPEPTTLLLLGFGLTGLAAYRKRFKKA